MATQLRDFSSRQDALTVFMDYQNKKKQNPLQKIVMEYFKPMQILYLCGEECSGSGTEVYQFMREKVRTYEASLPQSNRFVFCHYLRLNDLSAEWIRDWQERVQEFQNRLTVTEAFQQYHVVCLAYESSDSPLGSRKTEVAGLMKKLGTELLDIAHVTYLLYTNGFETLEGQEQGLGQLLYLLSRANTSSVLSPLQNRTWLKMLNYSDYSEEKAVRWSEKIEELDRWMSEEADPGQLRFLDAVRGPLDRSAQILRDEEMDFDSRIDIYPVHIDDFVKTGFLPNSPHSSKIGSDHEIIRKRKEEYFGDLQERLISEFDFQQLEEMVQKNMYYKDWLKVDEVISVQVKEEGSLEARMQSSLNNRNGGRAKGEIDELIQKICGQIRRNLKKQFSDMETKWETKQQEMQYAQKQRNIAGRYQDIWACFKNIWSETAFKPLMGMSPEFQKNICLIGSECYGKWYTEQYTIEEISQAYYCPDIDPTDVALLKMGDLLDLAREDAEQKLIRIL